MVKVLYKNKYRKATGVYVIAVEYLREEGNRVVD